MGLIVTAATATDAYIDQASIGGLADEVNTLAVLVENLAQVVHLLTRHVWYLFDESLHADNHTKNVFNNCSLNGIHICSYNQTFIHS